MAADGLRVTWHTGWNGVLEAALNALPPMEACPRELHRSLLTMHPSTQKIALVAIKGEPVALVGLRRSRSGRGFEPITNWLIPGASFPVRQGRLLDALEALNVRVTHGLWRLGVDPQPRVNREVSHTETHGMKCSEDFEAYWAKTALLKELRRTRRRCAKYRYMLNAPGAAQWAIRNWDKQWRGEAGERASVVVRNKIAEHLEPRNRHFSQALYDGDKLIGAATQILHEGWSVAGVLYYLPEYRNDGVGHRLVELSFQHAREAGLNGIDIGGGHAYKAKWAPVIGKHSVVTIWPPALTPAKFAVEAVRGLRSRIAGPPQSVLAET